MFIDDKIMNIESLKESTDNLLELTNEFSKFIEYNKYKYNISII